MSDVENCGFCQETLEDGTSLYIAPNCGHRFHDACFIQWITHIENTDPTDSRRDLCPVCRSSLSTVNPLVVVPQPRVELVGEPRRQTEPDFRQQMASFLRQPGAIQFIQDMQNRMREQIVPPTQRPPRPTRVATPIVSTPSIVMEAHLSDGRPRCQALCKSTKLQCSKPEDKFEHNGYCSLHSVAVECSRELEDTKRFDEIARHTIGKESRKRAYHQSFENAMGRIDEAIMIKDETQQLQSRNLNRAATQREKARRLMPNHPAFAS